MWPFDTNTDPNNIFAPAPMSNAEILFKLASALGPLAPFIGGTRTPMGRALGAGSVLAGGIGGTFADIMEAQRKKTPLEQQMLLHQMAGQAAQGATVAVPGTPGIAESTVPFPEAATSDFYEGPLNPTLTIPAVPAGPATTRRPQSEAELLASITDPRQRAAVSMVGAKQFVDEPKYAMSGNRVIRMNPPGGAAPAIESNFPETEMQTAQLEESRAQAKQRIAQTAELDRQTAQRTTMSAYFTKHLETALADGSVRPEAAVTALAEVSEGKYTAAMKLISPAVPVPLWDVAMSGKPLTEANKTALGKLDDNDRDKVIGVWQSARNANLVSDRAAEANSVAADKNRLTVLPGVFADKTTGEVSQITKGQHDKDPKNYKRISAGEAMTVDLLRTSFPMMDRMEELVPKVLAKYPSQQLGVLMRNYVAGKYGSDPDLQELSSLGASLSIEQARALSGSSRVLGSIFAEVKGQIVPGIKVTADTAIRQIKVGRREMENRVNSITGREIKKFESFGAPPPTAPGGNPYAGKSDAEIKRLLEMQ